MELPEQKIKQKIIQKDVLSSEISLSNIDTSINPGLKAELNYTYTLQVTYNLY